MELKLHIEFSEPFLPTKVIPQEVQTALTEALMLLEGEVVRRTPVGAYEALSKSIAAEPVKQVGGGFQGVVGTPLEYGAAVEYGTKPHWPPIGPLVPWVIRKLHVDEAQAKQVAFLIAAKIARRGTQGAHMFEHALEANRGRIEQIFERAGFRIATRLEKGEA
jgi:hypothetical protein